MYVHTKRNAYVIAYVGSLYSYEMLTCFIHLLKESVLLQAI